jgi:hypothetical protein
VSSLKFQRERERGEEKKEIGESGREWLEGRGGRRGGGRNR